MAFLLDTCAISELTKPAPDSGFITWFQQQSSDGLYICSMTLAELQKRILKLPAGKRKQQLSQWLTQIEQAFAHRCLPFDNNAAKAWASITINAERKGFKPAAYDAIIAAIGLSQQLTLVSRNEKDFRYLTVPLLNPWNGP